MNGRQLLGIGALVGGGALAVHLYRRRAVNATGFVWPVPTVGSQKPVISNEFRRSKHLGVDVMFPNGAGRWFVPDGTFALAAGPGVVRSAGLQRRGNAVVINHGRAATFYTHMERLLVAAGARVIAGQPLGVIGADPLDAEHLKHLHFELWPTGERSSAVDPAPLMRSWPMVTVADERKANG